MIQNYPSGASSPPKEILHYPHLKITHTTFFFGECEQGYSHPAAENWPTSIAPPVQRRPVLAPNVDNHSNSKPCPLPIAPRKGQAPTARLPKQARIASMQPGCGGPAEWAQATLCSCIAMWRHELATTEGRWASIWADRKLAWTRQRAVQSTSAGTGWLWWKRPKNVAAKLGFRKHATVGVGGPQATECHTYPPCSHPSQMTEVTEN